MNAFELLELSRVGNEFSQKLKKAPPGTSYIPRINEVLNSLSKNQQTLLREKFNKNFSDIEQLFDKLCEILVAYRFLNASPIFGDDSNGVTDLFLRNNGKYIEVKRINNSDFQNAHTRTMLKDKVWVKTTGVISEESQKECALYKKSYKLINKAVCQLEGKNGLVFLVYNLDQMNHFIDLHTRENKFIGVIQSYIQNLNLKDISAEIINQNK